MNCHRVNWIRNGVWFFQVCKNLRTLGGVHRRLFLAGPATCASTKSFLLCKLSNFFFFEIFILGELPRATRFYYYLHFRAHAPRTSFDFVFASDCRKIRESRGNCLIKSRSYHLLALIFWSDCILMCFCLHL